MNIGTWLAANKLWILLGVAASFNCFWLIQYRAKLRVNATVAVVLGVLHMVCSVLFAKIFAFIEGVPGGMSLYGGLFFLPVTFCLVAAVTKRNIAETCDVFTIPTIVTVSCARINCLFSGCCLGRIIPGTDGIRWPTRELELGLYVVLYIALRKKIGKPRSRGKLYPAYMITYGAFRFVVEWFRETENLIGFAHLSHIWSIAAMVTGGLLIFCIDKKQKLKSGKLHNPDSKKSRGGK